MRYIVICMSVCCHYCCIAQMLAATGSAAARTVVLWPAQSRRVGKGSRVVAARWWGLRVEMAHKRLSSLVGTTRRQESRAAKAVCWRCRQQRRPRRLFMLGGFPFVWMPLIELRVWLCVSTDKMVAFSFVWAKWKIVGAFLLLAANSQWLESKFRLHKRENGGGAKYLFFHVAF